MAMNHGSTSARTQIAPIAGFNRRIQFMERSVTASATIASPTIMRMSGPLMSIPNAMAVQNTAAVTRGWVLTLRSPCSAR